MTTRYQTGEEAIVGDLVSCQGRSGVVICVGKQLVDYGLDPEEHRNFIMIDYKDWGAVCEPADGEDIDFVSRRSENHQPE